jgi:hypothetical protein
MSKEDLAVIILSSVIFLINIASCVLIALKSKRFLTSKIILRLYPSPYFSWVFALLSAAAVYALWHFYGLSVISGALGGAVVSCAAHVFFMGYGVCGITSEALYSGGKIIYWRNIYDYYIDKKRRTVIFSSNIKGGLTLKGLTRPLKYKPSDEQKLQQYLTELSRRFNKIIIR